MNRNCHLLGRIVVFAAMVAILSGPGVSAKQLAAFAVHGIKRSVHMSAADIAVFEQRLTPYFTYEAEHHTRPPDGFAYVPDQIDRHLILAYSKSLSPAFRALYKIASDIPTGYSHYDSPGGHFEIFYTTSGQDRVSTTDSYSYGVGGNWRTQVAGSNNVPDYVDEVAWAADSAWSMEVDGFGFPAPQGYNDGVNTSSRFKILVQNLGLRTYGFTTPEDQIGNHGFTALVSVQNSWNDPSWFNTIDNLNYQLHPYNAVHITIAHEFFHGIQYGMAWNVADSYIPDNFTIGWIEGTAVLMEGLGYDSIKDYLQYDYHYFSDPFAPMLSNDQGDDGIEPYKNALITKFLFQKVLPQPGIGFVKTMFLRDDAAETGFLPNLQQTCATYGTTWPAALGAFHSQSFFTGDNARTGYFIKDAPLLTTFSYTLDTGTSNTKLVESFGLQTFGLAGNAGQGDTLRVYFSAAVPYQDNQWGVNIVLHGDSASIPDTIIPIPENNGSGSDTILGWQKYRDAVVAVSNGHDLNAAPGNVTVSFNSALPAHVAAKQFFAYPNPLHLANGANGITFTGLPMTSVRIYTSEGALVYSQTSSDTVESMAWKPVTHGGGKVVPGTYVALVGYRPSRSELIYRTAKVMVAP